MESCLAGVDWAESFEAIEKEVKEYQINQCLPAGKTNIGQILSNNLDKYCERMAWRVGKGEQGRQVV